MKILNIAVLCLLTSKALAQTPSTINFDTVIMGPDGPFKECKQLDQSGKCVEFTDLTLRRMCISAAGQSEKDVPIVEQVKHGKLASDLSSKNKIVLTADDIAYLKKQIAKLGYSTIAVYQAIKLLDPASIEK